MQCLLIYSKCLFICIAGNESIHTVIVSAEFSNYAVRLCGFVQLPFVINEMKLFKVNTNTQTLSKRLLFVTVKQCRLLFPKLKLKMFAARLLQQYVTV